MLTWTKWPREGLVAWLAGQREPRAVVAKRLPPELVIRSWPAQRECDDEGEGAAGRVIWLAWREPKDGLGSASKHLRLIEHYDWTRLAHRFAAPPLAHGLARQMIGTADRGVGRPREGFKALKVAVEKHLLAMPLIQSWRAQVQAGAIEWKAKREREREAAMEEAVQEEEWKILDEAARVSGDGEGA